MSFLRGLLRRFTFLPPGASERTCVSATALVVCAPAASTAVARTCTPIDIVLDVDDVCTLPSRLVVAHFVSSLEALTAVAVARLPTFGVCTFFGTGEDNVRVLACVTRLRLLPSAASSTCICMIAASAFVCIIRLRLLPSAASFDFNLHDYATLR